MIDLYHLKHEKGPIYVAPETCGDSLLLKRASIFDVRYMDDILDADSHWLAYEWCYLIDYWQESA